MLVSGRPSHVATRQFFEAQAFNKSVNPNVGNKTAYMICAKSCGGHLCMVYTGKTSQWWRSPRPLQDPRNRTSQSLPSFPNVVMGVILGFHLLDPLGGPGRSRQSVSPTVP